MLGRASSGSGVSFRLNAASAMLGQFSPSDT
jgi:hypothetical protein